ncbi:hypothetical protein Btru_059636 [Bulinus truncatus]|nr:hypothetical protein Btru_059636 [Bulinus truncatus]
MVLMAIVGPDYIFLCVDLGGYGKNSDGGLFEASNMGQKFEAGEMKVPSPKALKSIETKGFTTTTNTTCPSGYFGDECIHKCPLACNGTCDVTGQCYYCSQLGFRLPYCDQRCMHGTYGLNCLNRCSNKCLYEKCDPETGDCLQCREVGVRLPNCTHSCIEGTYGLNCQNQCPFNCKKCNLINGTCNHCPVGKGEHCTVNCATEKDKEICALYCPSQCLTWCNTTDSHCALCSAGYNPPFCNTTCQVGRYGHNCKHVCSDRCKHGTCDPISGSCFSCSDGYVGHKCNGQCIQGFYGPECDLNCPETCLNGSCDFVNGSCFQCQDGYKGQHCDELCASGKYGRNCVQDCPENCLNTCDPESGACWRCVPGYKESFCNVTCQQGSYGDGCNQICPSECSCDHVTGQCIECANESLGPDCKSENAQQQTRRNILELSLFVSVGLFGVAALVSCIMWWYRKHINIYWNRTTEWMQSKVDVDQLNTIRVKGDEVTSLNMYHNEENISFTGSTESDPIERHRKLASYLRHHGKSYTPIEYDTTELRVQYLKQIQTRTPLFQKTSEQYDADKSDFVNLSISHATTVESKHQAVDTYRHSQCKIHDKRNQGLATTFNASYSFPGKQENEIGSLITINKIKSAGEQSPLKSRLGKNKLDGIHEDNRSLDDHCIVKSTEVCLVSGTTKPLLAATVTYTSDTKSKLSDYFQFAKNNSLFIDRDGASADSLYGVTSQEFAQDPLSSEACKCVMIKHTDLFPFENYSQPCIPNVKSEQSISNDQSVGGKKKTSNKTTNQSPSMLDPFKVNRKNTQFAIDKSQGLNNRHNGDKSIGLNNTCIGDESHGTDDKYVGDKSPGLDNKSKAEKSIPNNCPALLSMCAMNSCKLDNAFLAMSSSNEFDDASTSTDQVSNILENSALKKLSKDQKKETIESHTDSASSAGEQESLAEEYSSLSQSPELPTYHPLDHPSASTRGDFELQKHSHLSVRAKHKKTASTRLKKYRKISPPKSLHGARILSQNSQANEDQETNRPTYSQIDMKNVAKQSSVARLSTSAVLKADSPRLVRCATTRQLSPMYTVRSATVNRLTPLPTPPPEGKMNLKPVSKLSSSSSVLEQTEDEQSLQL